GGLGMAGGRVVGVDEGGCNDGRGHARLGGQGQVVGVDGGAVGQGEGAFEDVFQFAHVAGEGVGGQRGEGVVGEPRRGALHRVGEALEDGPGQQRQVAVALAQGRDVEFDDVDAVVQV